ncbi:DNA ligase (ATP), variant 2 [Homalodisca vitripennis]|nr:DNA ligase (ATP), variant 2 [Homalodisca vitripennis]
MRFWCYWAELNRPLCREGTLIRQHKAEGVDKAVGGVWTLAPGALPRRFEAFAREREKREMSVKQMKKLDQLLFHGCSPFSVFRGCFAYFDCYEKVGEHSTLVDTPLNSVVFDFKFQSGQVCPTVNDQTTHIVVHSR